MAEHQKGVERSGEELITYDTRERALSMALAMHHNANPTAEYLVMSADVIAQYLHDGSITEQETN